MGGESQLDNVIAEPDILQIAPTAEENSEPEFDEEVESELFCYNDRLKDFVKEIGKSEGVDDVGFGQPARLRMQQSIKFLATVLIFDTMDILKKDNRVQIKPRHVDKALNKMLYEADGLQISITKIQELAETLEQLVTKTSLDRAMRYANGFESCLEEKEE